MEIMKMHVRSANTVSISNFFCPQLFSSLALAFHLLWSVRINHPAEAVARFVGDFETFTTI